MCSASFLSGPYHIYFHPSTQMLNGHQILHTSCTLSFKKFIHLINQSNDASHTMQKANKSDLRHEMIYTIADSKSSLFISLPIAEKSLSNMSMYVWDLNNGDPYCLSFFSPVIICVPGLWHGRPPRRWKTSGATSSFPSSTPQAIWSWNIGSVSPRETMDTKCHGTRAACHLNLSTLHIPTPRENRYVTYSSTSAPFSSISPRELQLMWRVQVTNNPHQASDLFTLHRRIDHSIAGDIRLYTFSV